MDRAEPRRSAALDGGEAYVAAHATRPLEWIQRSPASPYFVTETGRAWTPVGHNDAIPWLHMRRLFERRDLDRFERHLAALSRSGVTCIRMMLEYAQHRDHYLETRPGVFCDAVVGFWDALLPQLERHGLRLLLTPYDTYWMWVRWARHPYNKRNGGLIRSRSELLTSRPVIDAIKNRLSFAVCRWGGSGVIFAWDLWNEIHPAHAGESADGFMDVMAELSRHVREEEMRLYGRAHLQTVSLFGPELVWRAHMPLKEPIFRHPDLDFATIHIYAEGAIDAPRNTVDAARAMGRIVEDSIAEIGDNRPFLDTEHGPIHTYKDKRRTLPAAFDDEYFRHMQWAHLAAGGAGGGMRWPNRNPHVLTAGMRVAQRALADFLPLIDWARFDRRPITSALAVERPGLRRPRHVSDLRVVRFACASSDQAIIYVLRADKKLKDGRVDLSVPGMPITLTLPGMAPGRYRVTLWDTRLGQSAAAPIGTAVGPDGQLRIEIAALVGDLAIAATRLDPGS